jgi:hypothetical protein
VGAAALSEVPVEDSESEPELEPEPEPELEPEPEEEEPPVELLDMELLRLVVLPLTVPLGPMRVPLGVATVPLGPSRGEPVPSEPGAVVMEALEALEALEVELVRAETPPVTREEAAAVSEETPAMSEGMR